MREFYDAVIAGEGYIVIYDSVRSPQLAHPPHCPSVQAEHFKEKVITNRGKSGRYYWVSTISLARAQFDAVPCSCF